MPLDGVMQECIPRQVGDTVTYFDDNFKEWLLENYHLYLTYNDGMVLM